MDKIERRAQILARARDVFAKRGYHASKIEDIVAAAKVARGTFYLYFEDKRAVFVELVDRFLARLHLAIQRIDPHDPAREVGAQIRENILRVLTLFLQDRAMTKILLTDAPGLDADFDRKLQAVYEEVLTLLAESFAEGQGLGIVGRRRHQGLRLPDGGGDQRAPLPSGDARLRRGQRRAPHRRGLLLLVPGVPAHLRATAHLVSLPVDLPT